MFAVPRLQNPRLQNPTIENPRLQNDSLGNPRLQNDAVANPGVVSVNPTNTTVEAPRLQNPRLQNPRLQNESLVNAAFTDTSWSLTNDGNTTAAYTVNLVLNEPIPAGFATQLLIHKTTTLPAANGCTLTEQLQTVLVANIPDPEFVPLSDVANPRLQNPRLQNPTLALAPGEIGDDHAAHRRSEPLRRSRLRRVRSGDARGRRAVGEQRGRRRRVDDTTGRRCR